MRSQRSLCAQLSPGKLPLTMERGRFSVTQEQDIIFLLYDLGDIENEIHFMFYSPLYGKLRLCFSKGVFYGCFIYKAWGKMAIYCTLLV